MSETWERQKGESSKSFAWFTIYRDLGPTRTLPKTLKKIENQSKMGSNSVQNGAKPQIIPIPTLKSLQTQSYKWSWNSRATDYDNYLDRLRRKEREAEYLKLEDEMFDIAWKLMGNVKDNLYDLKHDFESKPTSISHANKSDSDAFKNAVTIIRLLCGKSTERREDTVEANLESSVAAEVKSNKEVKLLSDDVFMKQELEFMNDLINDKK